MDWGGVIIIFINIPQLYKLYVTKSGEDLSYCTLILDIMGSSFLGTYGILINKYPIIIANVVIIILAFMILTLKIKYSRLSMDTMNTIDTINTPKSLVKKKKNLILILLLNK